MVKGYLESPLSPSVSVKSLLLRRKERDSALKVTDDGRGQLGHLQRELVPVLACFPISNLSILDHSRLIEIFLFSNCFKYILGEISLRFSRNWMRFVIHESLVFFFCFLPVAIRTGPVHRLTVLALRIIRDSNYVDAEACYFR